MKIKRPGLLAATLIPIGIHIIYLYFQWNRFKATLSFLNPDMIIPYLIGYFLPLFAISYAIWGICVLIQKAIIKPSQMNKTDTDNSQTEKKISYITAERNDTSPSQVVYVKAATRADIPKEVEYDDQTGKKIVYIVEDED
ncbi:MAG TPA: hypothetical protein PK629_12645 [Oscillospiraceae bacterium]|nr:hypothetical protein [Oscillospiraceae bacterium]HPK36605.1 hypothetical protein [Oscillospiraceae bacterium]HPR76889.1 hypothetical protein [Oscillospiraceae bacterium]